MQYINIARGMLITTAAVVYKLLVMTMLQLLHTQVKQRHFDIEIREIKSFCLHQYTVVSLHYLLPQLITSLLEYHYMPCIAKGECIRKGKNYAEDHIIDKRKTKGGAK
jgi:hypothetical protein